MTSNSKTLIKNNCRYQLNVQIFILKHIPSRPFFKGFVKCSILVCTSASKTHCTYSTLLIGPRPFLSPPYSWTININCHLPLSDKWLVLSLWIHFSPHPILLNVDEFQSVMLMGAFCKLKWQFLLICCLTSPSSNNWRSQFL